MTRLLALTFAFVNVDPGELGELDVLDVLDLGPVGVAWSAGFALDFMRPCPSA